MPALPGDWPQGEASGSALRPVVGLYGLMMPSYLPPRSVIWWREHSQNTKWDFTCPKGRGTCLNKMHQQILINFCLWGSVQRSTTEERSPVLTSCVVSDSGTPLTSVSQMSVREDPHLTWVCEWHTQSLQRTRNNTSHRAHTWHILGIPKQGGKMGYMLNDVEKCLLLVVLLDTRFITKRMSTKELEH